MSIISWFRRSACVAAVAAATLSLSWGASAKTLSVAYNINHTEGTFRQQIIDHFSNRLRAVSGGRLTLRASPETPEAKMAHMPELLMSREFDMSLTYPMRFVKIDPAFHIFNLPFLFKTLDNAHNMLSGVFGDHFRNTLAERGLRLLAWYTIGTRNLASNKPIKNMEDLEGMVIGRTTMSNDYSIFGRYGAYIEEYEENDLYDYFQRGDLDIIEDTYLNFWNKKIFMRDHGYIYETNHKYRIMMLVMSDASYKNLDEREREWITRAVSESSILSWEEVDKRNALALSKLIDYGVSYRVLNHRDLMEAADKLHSVYRRHFPQLMEIVESYVATQGGGDTATMMFNLDETGSKAY
ncbi:MAG: TRAP transporter substrate-binding protein DctP [Succinivibrionaceae bacterium]|nr:TRAP transporter substrate-binding protein DctP [Succinivibrionaceae bacterium]